MFGYLPIPLNEEDRRATTTTVARFALACLPHCNLTRAARLGDARGPRPVEFARWVRERYPGTEVLPLTAHDRECYLAWMMKAGAAGYLTKNEASEALVAAVRRAAQGETCYTSEQVQRARDWREQVCGRWASLTAREREVLRLLARGLDNAAIAEALGVQIRTVEQHITNILNKLGLSSRLEAAVWMRDHMPEDMWKSTGWR